MVTAKAATKHKYIGAASVKCSYIIVHGLKLLQTPSFPGCFLKKKVFFPAVDGQKTTPSSLGRIFLGFFQNQVAKH